jgi:signal transduction histidine kinase
VQRHYPISEAGVWVDCIRARGPVIHNDYDGLPHKQGVPKGHAQITRELVVPVFRGPSIVAILGVGNKETDYEAHDVEMVQQLADLAWEIAVRKEAEEALRASEHLLAEIAAHYPNSYISIIENDWTVGFTSGQEFAKQGLNPDDFVGMSIEQVFGEHAPIIRANYSRAFRGEEVSFELTINDQHQLYRALPLVERDERVVRILAVVENVTDRKLAEEAMADQAEHLRLLSARLANAQEIERRRIARELHDQVGQNLTAMGINLNLLRPHLAEAPEAAQSQLEDLLTQVRETTGRIRNVIADLRPPELDDYGLVAALRWYGARTEEQTGLKVGVEGDDLKPRLPPQQATSLFRIAQEALANVVKHAQATQVTVTVEADEATMRMIVADDGAGFDPERLKPASDTPHWGLLTMQERAQAAEATWRVESAPGEGSRIVVEIARTQGVAG